MNDIYNWYVLYQTEETVLTDIVAIPNQCKFKEMCVNNDQ